MVEESKLVLATKAFVKEELENAEGGHDWFHIERVYKNALLIAKNKAVNLEVIALGALLHDIADSKFHNGDETVGPKKAKEFLQQANAEESIIEQVIKIIENISYRSGKASKDFYSEELAIVQDADRLDAIGAIGIARTFNYGGFKNRKIYDPNIPPQLNMSKEEYKKVLNPTINHFYEKLLLLKDKMNTNKGKELAEKRHQFIETFLDQFYAEWEGKV